MYEHIAWTPCLAHTVNLMLKDIARRPKHAITKAVQANFKLVTQSWSVEYNDEERNQW